MFLRRDDGFASASATLAITGLLEYRSDCPFKFTPKIDTLRFELGGAPANAGGCRPRRAHETVELEG
jgi:hypothetical protein